MPNKKNRNKETDERYLLVEMHIKSKMITGINPHTNNLYENRIIPPKNKIAKNKRNKFDRERFILIPP